MPGERLSMRKIREVLRLRLGQGLPQRAVAQSLRLSQGAVHGYMARARRAGLGWPLPDGIDAATGGVRRAEIFVAVLGASSYTFAEASWTQSLPDWIAVHVNMLAFIAGVPRQIVSDNLKSGITRACFYEPLVNRTYADMASHYGTAVIPARPYKPRDKAKVEVGVQVVQRWILARLRNRRFFSLAELNQAIRELVIQLNDRPMRGWGTTRRALYEQIDRPALRELPPTPYEYADWKRCQVNVDYHVEIDKHFYSVPLRLLREEVEARITDQCLVPLDRTVQ